MTVRLPKSICRYSYDSLSTKSPGHQAPPRSSWRILEEHKTIYYTKDLNCMTILNILVMMIFNEGAYLTFKSIFHNDLNLFVFDCEITLVSVPRTNQLKETTGAFDGARSHDLHIMSQTCNPLRHAATL